MLGKDAAPGKRHGQKQSVGTSVITALTEISARRTQKPGRLYKIAREGEDRKSNVGSSRLPVALARKHAESYRLSSPRPPQCGALWVTARLLTFSRGLLRRPLLRGQRVRIRLPPAESPLRTPSSLPEAPLE